VQKEVMMEMFLNITVKQEMEEMILLLKEILLLDVIPLNVLFGSPLFYVEELMMQQHAMLLVAVGVQDLPLLLLLLLLVVLNLLLVLYQSVLQ
jgi:hypothetical protein